MSGPGNTAARSPARKTSDRPRAGSGMKRQQKSHRKKRAQNGYWSGRVTKESDALDLEKGIFALRDAARIAASLKRSAEHSKRRKASPYRSALSMLVFYINRAGKNLPASRKRTLERAKLELRRLFGKTQRGA